MDTKNEAEVEEGVDELKAVDEAKKGRDEVHSKQMSLKEEEEKR